MRILLVISGSIAAYKALELIRLLRRNGHTVNTVLTKSACEFITPLAVSSLTGLPTYTDLFSLKDETEMGHIRLSREADAIIVAPASADRIAKLAHGHADDLASAVLLAADKPIYLAPAMNHRMWAHPATKRNLAQLQLDGARIIPPTEGEMACGEFGLGRMAEPEAIMSALFGNRYSESHKKLLSGKHAIVTSGPTHEPIDPVRYLGNRSSGKQGHAIAAALAAAGANVTLVTGPTGLPTPAGISVIPVTTAAEMLEAVEKSLPSEIFIAAAAVADWRIKQPAAQKLKKRANNEPPKLMLEETPDILRRVAHDAKRPDVVVGFAAETEALLRSAETKRKRKGADFLLANDVSHGQIFGADATALHFFHADGQENWGTLSKQDAAEKLVEKIAAFLIAKSRPPRTAPTLASNKKTPTQKRK